MPGYHWAVTSDAPAEQASLDRLPLPPDPASAGAARRFVRELLAKTGPYPDGLLDSALVVASELVTNAVRHAAGAPLTIVVSTAPEQLRIGVEDTSTELPAVVDPYEGGGRGMTVVEAMSSRWTVQRRPDGKVVWAVFDLPPTR